MLHVWKMIEGINPNLNNTPTSSLLLQTQINHRRGWFINLQPPHLTYNKCFLVKLFNSLLKHIRNTTNAKLEFFKHKLDRFLETVEDMPLLRSGANNSRNNNSNHIFDYSHDSLNDLEQPIYGAPNCSPPGEILLRRRPTEELAILWTWFTQVVSRWFKVNPNVLKVWEKVMNRFHKSAVLPM